MNTKKYLPILAAFLVGVTGAAGYAVHAQTATAGDAGAPGIASPAAADGETADEALNQPNQGSAQDPQNLDGETADDSQVQGNAQDPQHLDGEIADDGAAGAEVENGPGDTSSDTGETETNQ